MSLPYCPTCIYAKGRCEKTGVEIRNTTGCSFHTPKPITNADKIRAMSDEEMAELFSNYACGYCHIQEFCFSVNCEDTWLDWLRQEAQQ